MQGRSGRIDAVVSHDDLLVRWEDTGEIASVKRWLIEGPETNSAKRSIETLNSDERQKAEKWLAACSHIITAERPTGAMHNEAAKALGVNLATVYRAIRRYRDSGSQDAVDLLPLSRRGKPAPKRLDPRVEAILKAVIEEHYLNRRRPRIKSSYEHFRILCRNAGLSELTPHYNTFRKRIGSISRWTKTSARFGHRVAREKMKPIRGHLPGADYPLAIVQIDHHLTDVEVVDEQYRLSIGRPWVTVAVDCYSRMVVGVFLSLDSPSASSTGMCLINSMLPKETYLGKLGIDASWPVWGKPKILHADNGKDFRGHMLKEACRFYGIESQFRPVRTPHFGGHIERLIGTIAGWFQELPGATYSNPKEKSEGSRGGRPAITLGELERWLVTYITKVYHHKRHSSTGLSPLGMWQAYYFGPDGQKESLPDRIADEERLRLSFMPMMNRTMQRYGLVIDHIHYMSDALRHLIPAPDEVAKSYKIRLDPRDISRVWLFDPEIDEYLEVPYRDATRPSMSQWELRAVTRHLREKRHPLDEGSIFDGLEELRAIERAAIDKTKKARRNAARRDEHAENVRLPISPRSKNTHFKRPAAAVGGDNVLALPITRVIKPFPVRMK